MANNSKTYAFPKVPTSVEELKSLCKSNMTDAFEVAALSVLAFCNYENDVQATIDMINYLKGPEDLSGYDIQFIKERLQDKLYVPRSFFKGSTPANNYQPQVPYEIVVSDNPYSYNEPNYVVLHLQSNGADSLRPVKLRKKGDQWFIWQITYLSEIRKPAAEDPWA